LAALFLWVALLWQLAVVDLLVGESDIGRCKNGPVWNVFRSTENVERFKENIEDLANIPYWPR
jgi:hypothetical protein